MKRPTLKSKLWYLPSVAKPQGPLGAMKVNGREAMPAMVTKVHTDRLVDLEVTDAKGAAHRVLFCTLVQPGDPNPAALVGHCEWDKPATVGEEREPQSIGPGDVGKVSDVLGKL